MVNYKFRRRYDKVLTYPEKDTIYIDFGYCGIPKNLNIEKIREIDPIKLDIEIKS